MAAAAWGFRAVAGGDEDGDSDEDGWDIGVVRPEPQVGLRLPPPSSPGPAARPPQGGGDAGGGGLGPERR